MRMLNIVIYCMLHGLFQMYDTTKYAEQSALDLFLGEAGSCQTLFYFLPSDKKNKEYNVEKLLYQ